MPRWPFRSSRRSDEGNCLLQLPSISDEDTTGLTPPCHHISIGTLWKTQPIGIASKWECSFTFFPTPTGNLIVNTLDVDERLVNWWEWKACNLILGAAHPSWQSRPPTYKTETEVINQIRLIQPIGEMLLKSLCPFFVLGTIRKMNKRFWNHKTDRVHSYMQLLI